MRSAALEIKRVPEYTEAGAPGGYYQLAALDGSRPGAYYINLRNPAEEWPKFTLPTLTYHEGIPGHHWQISIQQESGSIPFIRSAILGFSAYAEGWGLYAEQLADEMGMYANDPFGRVGYLQSAAFRASRLVVDTGMHAKRWTREQAIAIDGGGDGGSGVQHCHRDRALLRVAGPGVRLHDWPAGAQPHARKRARHTGSSLRLKGLPRRRTHERLDAAFGH